MKHSPLFSPTMPTWGLRTPPQPILLQGIDLSGIPFSRQHDPHSRPATGIHHHVRLGVGDGEKEKVQRGMVQGMGEKERVQTQM